MKTRSEAQLELKNMPEDIIYDEIPSHLSYLSLRALRHSCKLFFNNSSLKKVQIEKKPVQIVTQSLRTFLLYRGKLWAAGLNCYGELGLGNKENQSQFVPVNQEQFDEHGGVKEIIAGDLHTLVICYDGTLWGCGSNVYSELGYERDSRDTFIQLDTKALEFTRGIKNIIAGRNATLMVCKNNTLWGCGDIGDFTFLSSQERTNFFPLINLPKCALLKRARDPALMHPPAFRALINGKSYGSVNFCILYDEKLFFYHTIENKLSLISSNDEEKFHELLSKINRLENDKIEIASPAELEIIDLLTGFKHQNIFQKTGGIKQVVMGHQCIMVVCHDGLLWGCGNNQYGQLGLGNNSGTELPKDFYSFSTVDLKSKIPCFVQINGEQFGMEGGVNYIVSNLFSTLVICNNGSVWACGSNSAEEFGLGHKEKQSTYVRVNTDKFIQEGGIKKIVGETVVLCNNGSLWGCGNFRGADKDSISEFIPLDTSQFINEGGIEDVYSNRNNTLVLCENGSIWGCGRNDMGQLGFEDLNDQPNFVKLPIPDFYKNKAEISQVAASMKYAGPI